MTELKVVRPFDELWRIAEVRIAAAKEAEKGTIQKQIAAGQALLELQAAIDAGEIGELATFWEWFNDNVRSIGRSTAEKYMQIARSAEPVAKAAELQQRKIELKRLQSYPQAKQEIPQQDQPPYPGVGTDKSPAVVRQTPTQPPPRVSAPAKTYPKAPDDDHWLNVIMEAIEHLSWDGLVRLYKQITERYRQWQQEGK
jgi:hypothetical protein